MIVSNAALHDDVARIRPKQGAALYLFVEDEGECHIAAFGVTNTGC